MDIQLFVTENCSVCKRTAVQLGDFVRRRKNLHLVINSKLDESPAPVFIFPALFVGEKLFSYGEVDLEKLDKHLSLFEKRLSA